MSTNVPKRLLLVEDNPGDARLLRKMLNEQLRGGRANSHSTDIVHVGSLHEAEKHLSERDIDLVLLDLELPDARGLTAVRRTRAAAPHVPLVVLTGLEDESLATQALQEGAQDYLIKGQIDARDLLRSLSYAIERKTMEEALLAERAQVGEANCGIGDAVDFGRTVFEQLGIGVAHSSLEGRFINVNPKLCDLLGYTRREALTLGIRDLTHPDDIGASIEARRRLLAGSVSHYEREARFIRKDGHELWTRIVTSLVRPANGAALHFTSLVQDISRQKGLENEQRETELRLRQLAENIREVLFLSDPTDGRMLYISPACELIWGQSTAAVYANPSAWMEAVHPEDLAGVQRAVATANSSGHMDHDYRIVRPDGTVRWINGRTFPVLDEKQKPLRLAGIAEDITERKRGEAEILQRIAELERAMYSTIDVIATMSEMRDPYTHGHEHRVAMMAAAIAEEIGLEPSRIEGVRIAGYLHDVGKIRVPAEILAKPTRLTQEEFNLIKLHPQASYDILKRLEFPWPLAEIARQHHERLDGSGYPQGLKDQQILLEAKILAVADTVEAMASHRPYRAGLGVEAALAEIEAGRGKLFEPLAVDACLRLFRQKGYQLPTGRTPHDLPDWAQSTGFSSRLPG